jgi:cell division protein FtsB
MLDFYQKRRLRTILNSRITQGVLVILAGMMLWNAFERYTIADMMSDRREQAEIEAGALQTQKDALEAQVQYLRDDRGIEAEMRRQFDIALPGEEVVVILEDAEVAVQVQPPEEPIKPRGWWPWPW